MSMATTCENPACTCDPCSCVNCACGETARSCGNSLHLRELHLCRLPVREVTRQHPDRRSAGELVPGFLDRLAQRGVTWQRVTGDADGSRRDVDIDAGHAGKLADLGPDGTGAVVAGHSGNRNGTSGHA